MVKKSKKIPKLLKKPEVEKIKRIKIRVVGIGGGGGNIVSEISQRVKKVSFFGADTDSKALKNLSLNVEKFQFGQSLTKGFGTGMNPEIAREAAKKEKERIKKLLENQDLVILIACLGGGVGSGASPIFARISKNLGNLNYGIFTLPFKFEGEKKMEMAKNALRELRRKLNAFSIIPNERIFQIIEKTAPLKKALSSINERLANSLQSLIEIIYRPALINIDFADLETVFEGRGHLTYLNSTEMEKEIEKVTHSPLYPYGLEGAKGVLLNISGRKDLSLSQVSQISKNILEKVNKEAKIIFGISRSPKFSKLKITILATGCKTPHLISWRPKGKIKKAKTPLKTKSRPKVKQKEPEKEKVVRKNALQVKKEIEEEEKELIEKERVWETPAFLRRKINKGQIS